MQDERVPVYLLGAGFTRAVIGNTASLTHELMSTLDISEFQEIHEEYERAIPDIEQFLSALDLKILHFLKYGCQGYTVDTKRSWNNFIIFCLVLSSLNCSATRQLA